VSKQFEEALSDVGVTKDGSRLERAAEKEKGGRGKGKRRDANPRRMVPLARRGRV